jgi:hypothetical protein
LTSDSLMPDRVLLQCSKKRSKLEIKTHLSVEISPLRLSCWNISPNKQMSVTVKNLTQMTSPSPRLMIRRMSSVMMTR